MPESPPIVPTIGSIAKHWNVDFHRVRYVIERLKIEPSGWAGNARVFTDADVERIGSELKRIAKDKEVGHGW